MSKGMHRGAGGGRPPRGGGGGGGDRPRPQGAKPKPPRDHAAGGHSFSPRPHKPDADAHVRPGNRPPLRVFTTTLWEYPSQHYDQFEIVGGGPDGRKKLVATMQGDREYVGATPSWVIWQLLQRYTREGDTVVDPMCGSGTTLDVCADLKRNGIGFDLAPRREEIRQADARKLPLADASADFVFVDPPYSTHVNYSDDPRCIGKLDASGFDGGESYYKAMGGVIREIDRVLKPKRYMGLYVSDSWRKRERSDPGSGTGIFMPIGFELFHIMRDKAGWKPVDIIAVARGNAKLDKGNWHKAAEEGNYFMRGFNYLFVMKKE